MRTESKYILRDSNENWRMRKQWCNVWFKLKGPNLLWNLYYYHSSGKVVQTSVHDCGYSAFWICGQGGQSFPCKPNNYIINFLQLTRAETLLACVCLELVILSNLEFPGPEIFTALWSFLGSNLSTFSKKRQSCHITFSSNICIWQWWHPTCLHWMVSGPFLSRAFQQSFLSLVYHNVPWLIHSYYFFLQ